MAITRYYSNEHASETQTDRHVCHSVCDADANTICLTRSSAIEVISVMRCAI